MRVIIIVLFLGICYGKPISAANYLGNGFDSKKGIYGLAPIFKLTYNEKKQWTSPYSNITFDVPDQMSVHDNDMTSEIVSQGIYRSYEEYKEMYESWFTFDIGVQTDNFGMGFQYNQDLGYVKDSITENYAEVIHGNHLWIYYTAVMYPFYILDFDDMFAAMLTKFPREIKTHNDIEFANLFVQTFGTHYPSVGLFGGKVNYNSAISQTLISKYDKEWIDTEYGFYFHYNLFNISTGGFDNQSSINISSEFLMETNSNVTFLGGNPTLANLLNISDWVNSLDILTYPFNVTMVGIWNLITSDDTKQNTMKNFMVNYINDYSNSPIRNDTEDDYYCIGSGYNTMKSIGCLNQIFIPNNIFRINVPTTQLISFNITMTETFDLQAWTQNNYESDDFLGFSTSSESIYEFYEEYYDDDKSLVMEWLRIAYLELVNPILPPPKLTDEFLKSTNELPLNYNNVTKYKYFSFFLSFGTAVIDKVTIGGEFTMNMWYDTTFIEKISIEKISEYSSWSFFGIIGDGYGNYYNNYQVNQAFNSSIIYDYSYSGGNVNYNITQWALWAKSVQNNMIPIKYHLIPIYNFIDNEIIKNNVKQALIDYDNLSSSLLQKFILDLKKNKLLK